MTCTVDLHILPWSDTGRKLTSLKQKLGEGREGGARVVDDEDEFAPEPYFENEEDKKKVEENGVDNFSPAVREMMKK